MSATVDTRITTDFPYEAGEVFVRAVDYITNPRITEHEASAILEGNATALFGNTTPANGATAGCLDA